MGRRRNLPLFEEVRIEDIGAEGKSIARVDNIVVFVKDAVPGDVVDLQVFRKKGRYMEARVVHYHHYSDQRVTPQPSGDHTESLSEAPPGTTQARVRG